MRSETARRLAVVAIAAALGAPLAGCGGSQAVEEESVASAPVGPPRARYGTLDPSAFRAEPADVNLDGQPDQIAYYSGSSVAWTSRDLDFDGRPEVYEYFDATGQIVEQEFQLDFDSAIDSVRFYDDGVLVRKSFSTDYAGTFTLFKYYDVDGTLLRVERDNDLDGEVDVWEYYDLGELARIGRDADGDGEPETIEEID